MSGPTIQLAPVAFDPRSRVGGEFYLWYNLNNYVNYGSVALASDGTTSYWSSLAGCGGSATPPPSGVYAIRAKTAIKASGEVAVSIGGLTATLPGLCPPGTTVEATGSGFTPPATPSGTAITGGQPGDTFDVICLPSPASDILICYDDGFTMELGEISKPIPRKFNPVDHYVRQRPSNTLNIQNLYCCNLKGLSALAQRSCCLIGKLFPDGGGIPTEVLYWGNVRLTAPLQIPQDANESVIVQATGSFQDYMAFTAQPTS
jgi:hypothetical protein